MPYIVFFLILFFKLIVDENSLKAKTLDSKKTVKMNKNSIDQQQKLSKSQSQSSILNLFKSHFSSPFLIKKFRSKSRDKVSTQQKQPEQSQKTSKLTLSKIKSTSKKQQIIQPQIKQPLLVINRNLDEPIAASMQQQQQQNGDINKKENILPTYIKKQQQQPSLTIKLSNDHLNDDYNNKSYCQNNNLKSTSFSPVSIPQQNHELAIPVTTTRQLSYLQLTCLINGYDTYTSNQTSPGSLLSTTSSSITPPSKIKLSPSKSISNGLKSTVESKKTCDEVVTPTTINLLVVETPPPSPPSPPLNANSSELPLNNKVSFCLF